MGFILNEKEFKNSNKQNNNENFYKNVDDNNNNFYNLTLEEEIKMLRNYDNLSIYEKIILETKIQKNGMEIIDMKNAEEIFDVNYF